MAGHGDRTHLKLTVSAMFLTGLAPAGLIPPGWSDPDGGNALVTWDRHRRLWQRQWWARLAVVHWGSPGFLVAHDFNLKNLDPRTVKTARGSKDPHNSHRAFIRCRTDFAK